ncbi:hypothetical protein SAMN05443637_10759 [Pseudonocardia thermophila]|jgi:hypothetical protein|uniref:DUF5313 domain-containing protein n=1 Tax=Pseudonocardia thermophila TaxID=1848 RepID=A0A1M6SZM1_PSETH|nr:DUF5313 family protein [Pseudonocardia thermophila]SHK50154.1 hypothetical protein SAMN05443637_10759 [Pseudonocardia thermophila]
MQRPGPWRWLGYAFGAGLPPEMHRWVLHDVTARTWLLRHFARAMVQIGPVAVLLMVLLPGDAALRISAITMGAVMGLLYTTVFVHASTEHRAIKAGYPEGYASLVRSRRRALRKALRKARAGSAPVR